MKYEDETQIRKDFARLFGWYEPKKHYNYNEQETVRTPEWSEIFCEVGKLLKSRGNAQLKERIEALEVQVMEQGISHKNI